MGMGVLILGHFVVTAVRLSLNVEIGLGSVGGRELYKHDALKSGKKLICRAINFLPAPVPASPFRICFAKKTPLLHCSNVCCTLFFHCQEIPE